MSGGKGGSTSSSVAIPEYIEDAARRNLTKADKISQLGYVPEYGPTIAALTPMQEAASQNIADTASAFGTAGGNMSRRDIMGGMPEATTYAGGVRGYSSAPIFEQSLQTLAEKRPGQKDYIDSFFIDPFTGAPGSNVQAPIDYTETRTPGDLGGITVGGGVVGGGDLVSYPGYVSADQQIANRIAQNRAEVDAIVAAGGGSIAPVPNVLDASQSDDLYNQYFQENFKAAQEHAESNPYGQTTGVPLSQQGFTTGESLLPPPLYDSQPTQEQLDYTASSLDPFGGPGPDLNGGIFTGGGADGVGSFGKVGDFFSGLNLTGPLSAGNPGYITGGGAGHSTDNDGPAGPGDTGYEQAQYLAALQGGGTGIIYKDDRREVYVDGVMVGNPKRAEEADKMLAEALANRTPPPPPQVIMN